MERVNEKATRSGYRTANIVVAGRSGAGKSTLLNAVFGKDLARTGIGRPVTQQNMVEYQSPGMPVRIWDTVGLEIDSATTSQSLEGIVDAITEKNDSNDLFDRIHVIWYCISAESKRYEDIEWTFIKKLHQKGVPFIIVMTKCMEAKRKLAEFEGAIRDINSIEGMEDVKVIRVLAEDYHTDLETIQRFGVDELVDTTMDNLPEFAKQSFVAAQALRIDKKREQAEEIVHKAVLSVLAVPEKWYNQVGKWVSEKIPVINVVFSDAEKKIHDMFYDIRQVYVNDFLRKEEISPVWDREFGKLKLTWGISIPFHSYRSALEHLVVENSFTDDEVIDRLTSDDKIAIMVAYFGYCFIIATEQAWRNNVEKAYKEGGPIIHEIAKNLKGKLQEFRVMADGTQER